MRISDLRLTRSRAEMDAWPEGKFLVDTVNAHSFVVAQKDAAFADALRNADALLPDGISIVKACRWLGTKNAPVEKIAGADLFAYEMGKLEKKGGTCFFLGSSPETLARIVERAASVYPHVRIVTYSPPYKPAFSPEDNRAMLEAVHAGACGHGRGDHTDANVVLRKLNQLQLHNQNQRLNLNQNQSQSKKNQLHNQLKKSQSQRKNQLLKNNQLKRNLN